MPATKLSEMSVRALVAQLRSRSPTFPLLQSGAICLLASQLPTPAAAWGAALGGTAVLVFNRAEGWRQSRSPTFPIFQAGSICLLASQLPTPAAAWGAALGGTAVLMLNRAEGRLQCMDAAAAAGRNIAATERFNTRKKTRARARDEADQMD